MVIVLLVVAWAFAPFVVLCFRGDHIVPSGAFGLEEWVLDTDSLVKGPSLLLHRSDLGSIALLFGRQWGQRRNPDFGGDLLGFF